jgi:hypothetical protein
LEEDLDRLLKIGKDEATVSREAPIFNDYNSDSDYGAVPFMGGHQGAMITSTPQGRFVYWKGKKPSELLGNDARLTAHLDTLPYLEGRPLPTIVGEGTALLDYSSDEHTSHRQLYMVEVEGQGDGKPNELLKQIPRDEVTTDAGDENDTERDARRLRNYKRSTRRRNTRSANTIYDEILMQSLER